MKAKTAKKAGTKIANKTVAGARAAGVVQATAKEDAVSLLKADHRKTEKMFAQYESLEEDQAKQDLVQSICNALSVHSYLEEEIFYPACREAGVEDDLMDEAQVEHDTAALLMQELLSSETEAVYYDAKVKVLGEYVQHHVSEEEKPGSGIFAKAKKAGLDMEELGQRLKVRKQELESRAETSGIQPPTPRSLGSATHSTGEHNMARNNQERDDQGRFMSDDDRDSGRNGGGGRYRSGGDDRQYGRSRDDDDNRSSRAGHGGWFGDSEGHSRASERGWENRGHDEDRGSGRGDRGDDRGSYSRSRSDDDRGYSRSSSRDDDRGGNRGHGGWFGDSEGHSRAAERGWESRGRDDDRGGYSRSRSDDERGYSRSSSRDDDRGGNRGHGGWFGDSEGHSRAAERGWESRGRDDDDDRGGRSGGSSRSSSGGRGHGGWFGDPEGHSRAAERGWENRDDGGRRGR